MTNDNRAPIGFCFDFFRLVVFNLKGKKMEILFILSAIFFITALFV
jgi:hypothetical protein